MTDREKAGLRGPVRICVEETAVPVGKLLTTTEYNSDGNLLTTRIVNPDGSEFVTSRTYDANGRLVKVTSGKPEAETLYAYDEAGRILAITNSPAKGNRTDFRYDKQGRKTTIQSFDPETLQRTQNGMYAGSPWDAAVAGFGVPVGGNLTTIYDEHNQPTEAQIRNAAGQLVTRFTRTYDAHGRILEEKPIQENPALLFADRFSVEVEQRTELTDARLEALSKAMKSMLSGRSGTGTTYAYDDQGHLTKMRERNFVVDRVTTITYNEHGEKSEERTITAGNSVVPIGVAYSLNENGNFTPSKPPVEPPAPPDLSEHSEVHYAYQYDSYGNWTQQTTYHSSYPDLPSNVRHRMLTYY